MNKKEMKLRGLKPCRHDRCKDVVIEGKELCKYCLIWDIAHTYGRREHIHCDKMKGGCSCRCRKKRVSQFHPKVKQI